MRILLLVIFCLGCFSVLVDLITIASQEYPRKREYSLGFDLVVLFERMAIAIWAAIVLWGSHL